MNRYAKDMLISVGLEVEHARAKLCRAKAETRNIDLQTSAELACLSDALADVRRRLGRMIKEDAK